MRVYRQNFAATLETAVGARALGHDILWSDRRVLVGFPCSGIPTEFIACLICDDFSRACHFFHAPLRFSLQKLYILPSKFGHFLCTRRSLLNFNTMNSKREWSYANLFTSGYNFGTLKMQRRCLKRLTSDFLKIDMLKNIKHKYLDNIMQLPCKEIL